jgi:hypothetical protein
MDVEELRMNVEKRIYGIKINTLIYEAQATHGQLHVLASRLLANHYTPNPIEHPADALKLDMAMAKSRDTQNILGLISRTKDEDLLENMARRLLTKYPEILGEVQRIKTIIGRCEVNKEL